MRLNPSGTSAATATATTTSSSSSSSSSSTTSTTTSSSSSSSSTSTTTSTTTTTTATCNLYSPTLVPNTDPGGGNYIAVKANGDMADYSANTFTLTVSSANTAYCSNI